MHTNVNKRLFTRKFENLLEKLIWGLGRSASDQDVVSTGGAEDHFGSCSLNDLGSPGTQFAFEEGFGETRGTVTTTTLV